MKIDENIRKALKSATLSYGSRAALGKECAVHPTLLCRYESGQINHIQEDKWERMWRVLRPWLPEDQVAYIPLTERAWQPPSAASTRPVKGPVWMSQLVDNWSRLPQSFRTTISTTAKIALKSVGVEESGDDDEGGHSEASQMVPRSV